MIKVIPKENTKDIEEIPKEVLENLVVTPVSNVTEVFEHAFK